MNPVRSAVSAVFFFVIACTAVPASAQVDFSGEWAPRFWEDQPERVPGPELGRLSRHSDQRSGAAPRGHVGRLDPDACPSGSAVRTRPITSGAGRRTCASPKRSIRSRVRSPRFTPSGCGRSTVRSIWMAVRIRLQTRCTRGPDSRPRSGTATCSPSLSRI